MKANDRVTGAMPDFIAFLHSLDPLLTFALSPVERQVPKYSGRSRRLLNEKSSAEVAGGLGANLVRYAVLSRL
jgi:hypothetical protein